MSGSLQVILSILLWGLIATAVMIAVSFASQNFGWSRLNLPFLLGSMFTGDRSAAMVLGFVLYMLIGWFISFGYYLVFSITGITGALAGGLVGLLHGLLLLAAVLPLLPYVHPRVASEYDGPTTDRWLEPPGFFAMNYGSRTPLVALTTFGLYGAILGYGLPH